MFCPKMVHSSVLMLVLKTYKCGLTPKDLDAVNVDRPGYSHYSIFHGDSNGTPR